MLHQLIRYRPIIKKLKKGKYVSLLEIGPGSHGITKFYDARVHGMDIDFQDYTGKRQELSQTLVPVMGSAERLPFKDGAFDMVFSCDMLEHIAADKRRVVVSEMVRAARKKVFLVFPCGKGALFGDRMLNYVCLKLGRPAPGWLVEHLNLDFPTRDEAISILEGLGLPYRVRGNAFLPLHYMVLAAESAGGLKRFFSEVSTLGRGGSHGVKKQIAAGILDALLLLADLWTT